MKAIFKQETKVKPLAAKIKTVKRHVVIEQGFSKDTIASNRDQLVAYLKKADYVFINKLAAYDDGMQRLTITIEIKKSVADKVNV